MVLHCRYEIVLDLLDLTHQFLAELLDVTLHIRLHRSTLTNCL